MKLHILSDLHFEFRPWPKQHDVNAIDADVTILAGDIGVGLEGIQWAMTINRPVIYVMGNHEFYGQRPMTDLWRKARAKVAGTHVHVLENESVVLEDPQRPGNRVRFLGATLWTDFCILGMDQQEACMEYVGRLMNDYNTIHVSRRGPVIVEPGFTTRHVGDRLTPVTALALHQNSRAFLEQGLQCQPVADKEAWSKTVVVTHHAPSARSLGVQQVTGPLDAAYASHLDPLVAKASLWIHGHTHISANYTVGQGTGRVICNPRGYAGSGEVLEFDPALVVEV